MDGRRCHAGAYFATILPCSSCLLWYQKSCGRMPVRQVILHVSRFYYQFLGQNYSQPMAMAIDLVVVKVVSNKSGRAGLALIAVYLKGGEMDVKPSKVVNQQTGPQK